MRSCVVGNKLLYEALVKEFPLAQLFWRFAVADGAKIEDLAGMLADVFFQCLR